MILRKGNLELTNNSQKAAIGSFIIGTIIFLLFLQTELMVVTLVGLLFLLIAVPVNIVLLFQLLYKLFTTNQYRNQILITTLMLLINIPIAYFYYTVAVELGNKILALD